MICNADEQQCRPECRGWGWNGMACRFTPSPADAEQRILRPQIDSSNVNAAVEALRVALVQRLRKKGFGSFAGKHEILGILQEEFYELTKAVHEGDRDISLVEAELMDIAVGAVFGVACIRAGVVR